MTGRYHRSHYNLAKYAYANADTITVVSNSLKKKLEELFKVESQVIPNFIDFEIFNIKERSQSSSLDIIGIGDLIPRKQWSHLIDAFATIQNKNSDCTLTIIGEGASRSALEKQIEKLLLTDKVKLAGKKTKSEVAAHLQRVDLLIHTSKTETFGLVILEALACGTPVISYNNGGVEEFRGLPGIQIIDEINQDNLNKTINEFLQNKSSSPYSSDDISKACQSKYGVDSVVAKLSDIYKELHQ